MANTSPARIWTMRLAFPALALLVMFFHLLPLETEPRFWAPPDLLMLLAMAWSLRRPDFVPALSIGLVMLLADLLFQRPPGLLALLTVLGCGFLKARAAPHRESTFASEWLAVALTVTGISTLNRLVLVLFGVQQAPLGLTVIQAVMTIAAYPLAVWASQSILGVRKLSPAEAETLVSRR
ncbi:rod shape-determining protein MreD [Leisingera caerulea]|uniref:Rod shape-determining protein MreD n=1 Tax=Leisingera caerulea TaxID=506591 RepID=A0ABY5WUL2_LEICA|nr:rod shape-determining protein MreD [Leisingera caerulea]UWQ49158.1 rod shape-determining protein MreD [Leisingera caerulea]UWQ57873.1 rod shape-determining protein MreD [Leisingera caerulea]UWQ62057.1 rod shape-determining protein MreD [Leisingera caerulea]